MREGRQRQRKRTTTVQKAQYTPARLSDQIITGYHKRLAELVVLNRTFVHWLKSQALLCKSNFVEQYKKNI